MEDALDYIEKRRWGIIVTFMVHVGLLLYLQVETYDIMLPQREFELISEVTEFEDYIEINPDHVITEDQFNASLNPDIKNITRDMSDQREKSYENYSRSSIDEKVEQSARELEQQYFEEFANGRPTSPSTSSEPSTNNTNSTTKPNNSNNTNTTAANQSGGTQFAGQTMVSYKLENRVPHNKNDWYIRNPGYTCNNANGKVVVAIRVNNNGDVVSARYVPEMSNGANNCMIEQAERYAKMSRFAYSGSAPKTQEGYIYYNFVSRK